MTDNESVFDQEMINHALRTGGVNAAWGVLTDGTEREVAQRRSFLDTAAALEVPVKALDPQAQLPTQGNPSDAGYDLRSTEIWSLGPGQRHMLNTGIAVAIPEGYVGYIKPRSGLALRYGIDVLGGVIDSGYRGEIRVILLNTGDRYFQIEDGDRIAQLVVQPVASVVFRKVRDLDDSQRGAGGFGSTGTS